MHGSTLTRNQLAAWMGEWMERELGVAREQVDATRPFVGYGMDSIHATMLVGDLEELLGRRLPPTLTWDHPTVDALAVHLAPEAAPTAAPAASAA